MSARRSCQRIISVPLRVPRDDVSSPKLSKNYLRPLTRPAGRMNYPPLVAAGVPIGSGVTEAACKVLVKQRLCGSGMQTSKGTEIISACRSCQKIISVPFSLSRKTAYFPQVAAAISSDFLRLTGGAWEPGPSDAITPVNSSTRRAPCRNGSGARPRDATSPRPPHSGSCRQLSPLTTRLPKNPFPTGSFRNVAPFGKSLDRADPRAFHLSRILCFRRKSSSARLTSKVIFITPIK